MPSEPMKSACFRMTLIQRLHQIEIAQERAENASSPEIDPPLPDDTACDRRPAAILMILMPLGEASKGKWNRHTDMHSV